jgi:undecaprenyl-diphosphatase
MEKLLLSLQNLRSPVLDKIMLLLTQLGGTVTLLAVLCLCYWCVDKGFARKLALSFFLAGMAAQIFKICFRVPRPFVRWADQGLTQVEGAGATGYSFPSGHTQSAASLYGTFAAHNWRRRRSWILTILCVLGVCFTGFTRLYLGVHTILDVIVGAIIGLVVVVLIEVLFETLYGRKNGLLVICLMMAAVSIISLTLAEIFLLAGRVDGKNLLDIFNAATAGLTLAIIMPIEEKFLAFDPKAGPTWYKIVKFIVGGGLLFGLKVGGEAIIGIDSHGAVPVSGGQIAASVLHYFIMIVFAFGLYPWLFETVRKKLKMTGDERGQS